VKMQL